MAESTTLTSTVPIASILIADEYNGRAFLDPRRVAELADVLAVEPLLHPITLRHTTMGLRLVAGRHRLAAYKKLGRTDIAATILNCDDATEATLRLTENLARVTLSPVEQAHQLAALVTLENQGVEAVAVRLARSVDWILDRLEILTWPEELAAAVHSKRIPLAAAKLLVRISPPELRARRIADASNHGCSAATARLWLQHAHIDDPNAEAPPVFSSRIPQFQQTTEVKALCAGCNELVKIEETELQRWCSNCLSQIRSAQQEASGPWHNQIPDTYDPGPPVSPERTS